MAPEIQAEFVVFTNCKDWHVQRRIQEGWCTMPDLPREIDRHTGGPITKELLDLLKRICFSIHARDLCG